MAIRDVVYFPSVSDEARAQGYGAAATDRDRITSLSVVAGPTKWFILVHALGAIAGTAGVVAEFNSRTDAETYLSENFNDIMNG